MEQEVYLPTGKLGMAQPVQALEHGPTSHNGCPLGPPRRPLLQTSPDVQTKGPGSLSKPYTGPKKDPRIRYVALYGSLF